mgnify:FL=1
MINLTPLNSFKSVKNTQNAQPQGLRYNSYVQKPDSFERTCPVNFTGSSNRLKQYGKVTDTLIQTGENAQTSLNGQLASDGWAGRVADKISVLWNSKNRAHLVQADIDTYKSQMQGLKDSIKENKFKDKFKEVFGIEYVNSNVTKYSKKAKQFEKAVTTKCMADITKAKLSKDLEIYNKFDGELKDYKENSFNYYAPTGSIPCMVSTTPKETVFKNLENALIDTLGSKEILNDSLKTSGIDVENATIEGKYKCYGIIANYLVETSKETANKYCDGKSLEDLRKEYDDAYKLAYGNKNDIQKRVDKYNKSQEIGAAAVRGATRSAIMALTSVVAPETALAKILYNSVATFGIKIAVDGSDKLTNQIDNSIDMNPKAIKKLVRSSAISAADKFASSGLKAIIPAINTTSEVLDFFLDQGKEVLIDTTVGLTSERLKQGKWLTNQIVPRMVISTVFRNLGADSELAKQLLKITKGSINQAIKKETRDYEVVKQFVNGTKVALNEGFLKDNGTYGELKKLADKDPDKYEKLMVEVLQKYIEEQDKDFD